ncbi:putative transporter [Aaosphaeria arxii CBS 175.79]|uniref:Putative transporter n=1 Tax=Aaosphaeria arxii CBS 175.79 TaxID=1450172 RepID=A0A6A5XXW3_9PLEO|nr:putative transporter [Aaosphaeria arxii CBS 175.79]KAF2017480.1 putative transporter [Aaosphaeria arxii CBS 175.79]
MPATITVNENSLWTNRTCLWMCCVVSMANMQYGFDSAAVGALQAMPGFLKVFGYEDPNSPLGYGIDSTVQQLITSLLTLGSFVSALVAGYFGAFFGRREGLWAACALNAVACAIQIGTDSAGVLYFGRLLLGFANGFLVTFSNVYTSEVAPSHLRGIMVALFAYWVNIGSIVGAVVVNYTKDILTKNSYRIPIGCLYIVPTFLAIGLFFVPESPRWLLHKGKTEQARRSLERLRHGATTSEELELEWTEMTKGVEEEKRVATSVSFIDMFRGHDLRRTLLCYGMIACQTASGVWFLIAYATYYYTIAGVTKPFEYSILQSCIAFIGVNVGMYAIKHWVGRRTILIMGAALCGLCQLASAIAATVDSASQTTGKVLVAFTVLFMFFYNGCVGAASYPVATELVSSRLRAWTVGSATALGYVLAWLTGFCSPYFINPEELNWGPKYGYIWFGSNMLCMVFFFFLMPELKNRSLEEIDEIFEAGVPARKFSRYECRIVQDTKNELDAQHQQGKHNGVLVESAEKVT